MNFRDIDKQAIIENAATFSSSIEIIGQNVTFTENDCLVNWKLEDFRYVPNNGFIGQFVERLLDGTFTNVPADVVLENSRIKIYLTVHNGLDNSDYTYSYGTFMITKINNTDTSGKVSFESCDLTKLFNVEYSPAIAFPCTALELVNDVCNQVGVPCEQESDSIILVGAIPKETVIPAGSNVCMFVDDAEYFTFTPEEELSLYNSILFIPSSNTVLVKTKTDLKQYTVTTTGEEMLEDGVLIDVHQVPYLLPSSNMLFVVDGNHFEHTSCREVIKEVSKLIYASARITSLDTLDFDVYDGSVSTPESYNIIDTNHHYGSISTDVDFGPVNKVVLGLSNVSGENVYYPDEMTDENVTEIDIWDNPITYTDELRRMALQEPPSFLGMVYTPLTVKTIGHPWLNSTNLIGVENVDGTMLYTYPFDITLIYNGYITTEISSKGTMSVSDRNYNYDNSIKQRLLNAEIAINKAEGEIKQVTKSVEDVDGKLAEYATLDIVDEIEKTVQQVQTDSYTKTDIQKIVTGSYIDENGNEVKVTKVETTSGTFDENGMHYEKTGAPTKSTINEKGVTVDDAETETDLLYAGYVDADKVSENEALKEFEGQSVVYTENTVVNNFFSFGGVARLQKYSEEVEGTMRNGIGFFYIGE